VAAADALNYRRTVTPLLLVMLILAVAFGVAFPLVLFGFRLPRMDSREGDPDFDGQPILGWPPTPGDRAELRRLGWVLLALGLVFALLLAALLLALRFA
jgi:hypothetical protein